MAPGPHIARVPAIRRRRLFVGLAGGVGLWLATLPVLPGFVAPALGQDRDGAAEQEQGRSEASGGEDAPKLTPPELQQFVEAEYPPGAREAGVEGAVLLELTIDRQGRVSEAAIVESPGHGLGEAAREAALQLRFEPARRGDEPIPSVIQYRYVFELEEGALEEGSSDDPSPGEPEAPQAPGILMGRVLDIETEEPLAGVRVHVRAAGGERSDEGTTGEDGQFHFDELTAGDYLVELDHPDYGGRSQREQIRPGEATELTYRLRPEGAQDEGSAYVAVAEVEAPPREVVRRKVEREELTRIAGTRGDALRTVELLPGVGRPPFGAGTIIVRGSAPEDSEVFFNGMPVPLLYHFGGVTSFMNSRLLDSIEFYPGNFSARYGRKIGGILEVKGRDPATDGLHGVADLNVIDASILAEGPIGERASVAIALRRSHIDAVFDKVVPDDAFDVVAAPVYWDYQAFLTWRPTDADRIRAMVYGSSDRFRVFLSDPIDSDPAIDGNVDLSTQFHFGQLAWTRKLSPDVEQELTLQVGPTLLDFGLGDEIRFDGDFLQVYGRAEWRARISPRVRLMGGLDVFYAPFSIDFVGPPPRQREGNTSTMDPLPDSVARSVSASVVRPGFYLETDLRPLEQLQLLLGLRLDYYEEIAEWSFDPRLVALYSLREGTRLKAGVGLFSQPPELTDSDEVLGNPNLEPLQAVHLNLGADHELFDGVRVGAEGFYKSIWNRPVETPGGVPPRFVNRGRGRIYGLELSGRVRPAGRRWFAFVSYTLSRSLRKDGPDARWRLFDFDQTHILSLASTYELGRGWEVGAAVRLVSGNPRTPIEGSVLYENADLYYPINGPTNSARNPLFHRLDLRVQKTWTFDAWRLALYLDVQNTYNAKNPEGRLYNYDYSESETVRGLPVIPSLGVRGEL